jgi:DNA mismatch repair protein MutL
VKIRLLPPDWASRIAAGEVVERPASVVKELVENSLDAGASEVSVWVEASGTRLIRVADNGEGMDAADLRLAVERHATSKLGSEADLSRVSTLGFRGEALPSIAAVSRLEIVSRPRGAPTGYRLSVEGGAKGEPVACSAAPGTTVEMRDLFFNTPARRKFLRSPATELGHISEAVDRMALAFPAVHFRLFHGSRLAADYTRAASSEERVLQVLGPELARGMIDFEAKDGGGSVRGFLSVAPLSFPNSRYLFYYVNRRFVRDRVVLHAILEGYETLLMKGRYPAAVLYLELPFEEVDVNVHPAKVEVRFRRQAEVHERVVEAVRAGLARAARREARNAPAPSTAAFAVREADAAYRAAAGDLFARSEAGPSAPRPSFFSSLRILGQVAGCYLVCESASGLVLIDQHAAHERAAFEAFRRRLEAGELPIQRLLIPQELELPLADALLLEARLAEFEAAGFRLRKRGPTAFALESIPALLPRGDYRDAIRRMVSEAAEVERADRARAEVQERLMTIACHSVVRAHQKLEKEEIHSLLQALDRVDFATQCPHGRPVVIEISTAELARLFKRA